MANLLQEVIPMPLDWVTVNSWPFTPLQWHHNEYDGVSNHQRHHCVLNRLFRRRSNKIPKLRVTGLCDGNSPVDSEHKGPVTWKMFPLHDVIMTLNFLEGGGGGGGGGGIFHCFYSSILNTSLYVTAHVVQFILSFSSSLKLYHVLCTSIFHFCVILARSLHPS